MRFATGVSTHKGQVRANNEDAFLVDERRNLFAVADGMGGHRGGEVASHTAIEALRASVASGDMLADAVARANDAVLQRAAGDENLAGMGTTMTAVTAAGGAALLVAHVGDSRAYLLRGGALERVTEDHSLVEELVRDGRLTPEQAEAHPQRAIVTRALGVDRDVDVDTYTIAVEPGDRVVLCSDGLTTMVRERDVERVARSEHDPQRTADALVAAANDAGGEDNITVVVVDVLETDPSAAPPAAMSASEAPPAPMDERAPDDVPPPAAAKPRGTKARTLRGAILVIVPIVLVIGAATAALGWYARRSYYVGVDRGEVVVYKGVPGGVLGWDPTVDRRTGLKLAALPELDRDRVQTNNTRGSLATALAYVGRLQQAAVAATSTTTTTAPRTTTTAKKPKTTTTRPRTATAVTKP